MGRTHELRLPFRIRLARADDLRALEWGGEFWSHRALIEDAFARQTRGEVAMLIADVNDYPGGQAWIDFARKADEGIAVIWAVRVHPMLRRQGLALRLMIAAEEAIARRGVGLAELGVEPHNHPARSLYRRLGYREAGAQTERTRWVRPDGRPLELFVRVRLMRKELPRHATVVRRTGS
ncbi:MAG: GNAT family N-acetyltransferase [Myxococcaceae bacterium]|nr:GNAT family N-acetyltransferase [Myxococcaceae bacterium]